MHVGKVLIIEDDPDISELVSIHLKDMGCEITRATNGLEGFQRGCEGIFDVIVLDIMLSGMNGFEVCRRLRENDVNTPILMLTAKSEEIDKVLGLETGADDYLTKPFSIREFVARVKVLFRRLSVAQNVARSALVYSLDELMIDEEKRKVMIKGNRVDLTPKEYDLLQLLATRPGRSYSREDLLKLIWGHEFSGYEHTVNSHINRLRSKIEPDFSKPRYILTTWGIGYRFSDEIPKKKISYH